MLLEAGDVRVVGGEATAGGDDLMAQSGHLGHELTLDLAESGFAVLRENLRDGLAGASLNPFVGIDELVAKLRSQVGEEVFGKRVRFNGLNETNNVIVRSVLATRPV